MALCTIGDVSQIEKKSIKPQAGVKYHVYSLPAFDNNKTTEYVDGSEIKSNKLIVEPNTILMNKLNVKFKRVWNLDDEVEENGLCSPEYLPMRAKDDSVLYKDFLYYILISEEFTEKMFASRQGTSNSHQRIEADTILNYEIDLPDLDTQKKIASFLRNFDDKVAVNNQIYSNLSEQISTIYREWFVNGSRYEKNSDGEFIGVSDVSLADLMDYAGGSQPPASEFIDEEREGYIRFVQIRDYDADNHITYIPISKRNKLCDRYDIMIARYGAALGRICFGLDGAYNVALAKVFPKKEYYREFLRAYLSSNEFYEGINIRGGRSAQSGFNQSDIKSFRVCFPNDDSIVREFEEIIHPLITKQLKIKEENYKLFEIRDTIMPQIMQGKLDVFELQMDDYI